MAYNLHHNNAIHFVPEDTEMYAESMNTSVGFIYQSYEGLLDVNEEFIAPFNIHCYLHKQMIYIQIIECSELKFDSTVTQFCSLIPENECTLPKAVFLALEHIKSNHQQYENMLSHLLISTVGIQLFEDEAFSHEDCSKKANLLYQLAYLKQGSPNSKLHVERS